MNKILKSAWFRGIGCLAVLPSMTGCTVALWTPACATHAMHPQLAGLVRNYPDKGSESLVITYRAPGDLTDVNLVVPLDADRLPRFPFGIVGRGYAIRILGSKDPVELAGSIEQRQLSAILASSNTIPGDRERLKAHFNSADWSPAGGASLCWPGEKLDRQGTAVALAYRTDATGQIFPIGLDSNDQAKNCDPGNNNGNSAPQEPPATVQVPIYNCDEKPDQTALMQFKHWIVSFAPRQFPAQ